MSARATKPVGDVLPKLLRERRMSLRQLADHVAVDVSHLSRGMSGEKRLRPELLEQIAAVLDLPDDYFLEVRDHRLQEKLAEDPKLRDQLYRLVVLEKRRRPSR